MTLSKTKAVLSTFACAAGLAACGGVIDKFGPVGGTLTGLGAGLQTTLQNNGGDNLVVSANGPFTFPTQLASLAPFNITVLGQPTNQFCRVTRPTGVIPTDGFTATITSIACAPNSLGVTVSGLATGSAVSLANASTTLAISANGLATFPGILAGATAYAVTVSAQPSGQVCTLSNASGSIAAGVQSLVGLSCL